MRDDQQLYTNFNKVCNDNNRIKDILITRERIFMRFKTVKYAIFMR